MSEAYYINDAVNGLIVFRANCETFDRVSRYLDVGIARLDQLLRRD